METWDAITSRRNVRTYEDRPIPKADLDKILEAARRTPSSRNNQPWDFVVVTDKERLLDLSKVWSHATHIGRSAATIALIAPNADDALTKESTQYDLGQATMSIMLAAADLSIGTGHSAVTDQDHARKVLGFPEDRFCAWLIALGYPGDRPLKPNKRTNRRPFDEVVHLERW
jgi:nitroreductase